MVERRDLKPCVGTVAGQDVGNTDKDLFQPLLYEGVGLNPPAVSNDFGDDYVEKTAFYMRRRLYRGRDLPVDAGKSTIL